MNIKQAIERIIEKPSSIKDYFDGNFWYKVYKLNKRLVPERIRTTAEFRWFTAADRECVKSGACVACGCKTAALFFAKKGCEADVWLNKKPCYPPMPTKEEWKEIKKARK